MCLGGGGGGRRRPPPLRHCPSHRDPCIALCTPRDPLGMRERPSCSGATSAVLTGCPFSVPGHTWGDPPPAMEHPHTPPCQGVTADPSLPRRYSRLHETSPERQCSPQRRGRSPCICTVGHGELTHMQPGCSRLTEQVGALSWSGRNHSPGRGPSPVSSVGFPASQGEPSWNRWDAPGSAPTGKGSPRRASRNAFPDEGNTARHGGKVLERASAPAQKVGASQESRCEGPKACWEHPTEQVTSQAPALPHNFQNMLSSSVHHPVSSSMSQEGCTSELC